MKIKHLFLIALFTIGFSFTNCNPCGDCPDVLPFFDIRGLEVTHKEVKSTVKNQDLIFH